MHALPELSHQQFIKLSIDTVAAAKQVNLVYVNDSEAAGILRLKTRSGFTYKYNNRTVKDRAILERIKN